MYGVGLYSLRQIIDPGLCYLKLIDLLLAKSRIEVESISPKTNPLSGRFFQCFFGLVRFCELQELKLYSKNITTQSVAHDLYYLFTMRNRFLLDVGRFCADTYEQILCVLVDRVSVVGGNL